MNTFEVIYLHIFCKVTHTLLDEKHIQITMLITYNFPGLHITDTVDWYFRVPQNSFGVNLRCFDFSRMHTLKGTETVKLY